MSATIDNTRVRLNYPIERVREPVLYHLIQDYHLVPNVRTANIEVHSGGVLVLDLAGARADLDGGLAWLRSLGVRVEELPLDAD